MKTPDEWFEYLYKEHRSLPMKEAIKRIQEDAFRAGYKAGLVSPHNRDIMTLEDLKPTEVEIPIGRWWEVCDYSENHKLGVLSLDLTSISNDKDDSKDPVG